MRVRFTLSAGLILWACFAFAQGQRLDSLSALLKTAEGEKRVEILHQLIPIFWNSNPQGAEISAKEAFRLSEMLGNKRLGATSLRFLGGVKVNQGLYDSALYYTEVAYSRSSELNDSTLMSHTLNNIGFIYYLLGSYTEALDNLLKAVSMKKIIKQDYGYTLVNVGLVYTKLGDYTTARQYLSQALDLAREFNNNNVRLDVSNAMALTYLEQEDLASAIRHYDHSVTLATSLGNKNWLARALSGLGQVYFRKGIPDSSMSYFRRALALRTELEDRKGISEIYYFMANIQLLHGRVDSAHALLNRSHVVARKIKAHDRLLENYRLYSSVFEVNKQYDSALSYERKYNRLKEQQFTENTRRSIAAIELKLREEEGERKLAASRDLLKSKTLQLNWLTGGIIVSLALCSIIFIFYRRQKNIKENLALKNLEVNIQKEQIEKKNHELVELNTEKNNLISLVAHDLKSPLNQIRGMVNVLKLSMGTEQPTDTLDYIGRIDRSTQRLIQMIGKILDVEAIESHHLNLTFDKVDASALVQEVADRYQPAAGNKEIAIAASVCENGWIFVDQHYTEQVVDNLLSNALKFSPRHTRIEVRVVHHVSYVQIEVQDEGPGLTAADKEKLFRKYQKLSAVPTGDEGSTGLGLSIVKRFVDAMGGEIWCESEPGRGAKFCVRFPAAEILITGLSRV